jgi:hypothetical protein
MSEEHLGLTNQHNRSTSTRLPSERVWDALAFREADIRPYYIWVDEEMMSPLAQWYGVENVKEQVICDHTVMKEIKALASSGWNQSLHG